MDDKQKTCPQCGSELSAVTETPTGKKLQRCSKGSWNAETKQVEGCPYVKWLLVEPTKLDEKCPSCGANLVLQITRYGKKLKRCETGGWDPKTRKPTGCEYVEWITGKAEPLADKCPDCSKGLVLYTTAKGRRMIKCETGGWNAKAKKPTGCEYVQWLRPGEEPETGEEHLPQEQQNG